MVEKRTVYVLTSDADPGVNYVGLTSDLDARLIAHNAGHSRHTNKYRPWSISVAVQFASGDQAAKFEKYLKSGSGRAFLHRHLLVCDD